VAPALTVSEHRDDRINPEDSLRRFFDTDATIETAMRDTLAIILKPILGGWAVCLTDGRELARFRGPGAHGRALHWLRLRLA
jgi:hypothetical protein